MPDATPSRHRQSRIDLGRIGFAVGDEFLQILRRQILAHQQHASAVPPRMPPARNRRPIWRATSCTAPCRWRKYRCRPSRTDSRRRRLADVGDIYGAAGAAHTLDHDLLAQHFREGAAYERTDNVGGAAGQTGLRKHCRFGQSCAWVDDVKGMAREVAAQAEWNARLRVGTATPTAPFRCARRTRDRRIMPAFQVDRSSATVPPIRGTRPTSWPDDVARRRRSRRYQARCARRRTAWK